MYLNGEGIEIFHQPAAHTDGDAIVFFRRSDVVVAGDIFDTTRFPVIDIAKGGSIQGEIAALQKLVDTAIPSVPIVSREEGTLIIPGHGRICDQLDVVEYRDMVTIIRDRIRDLMKQGLTLEQIKAASPARGYMRRYGSDTGLDHERFRRSRVSQHERESAMRAFIIAASSRSSLWHAARAACRARNAAPQATAKASAPDRYDRLLGRFRDRRLALPHGHAPQRRLPGRTHDRTGAEGRGCLGSGGRRSRGQSMQSVWRRRDHAACRRAFISPGRTITRCGSTAMPACRRGSSISTSPAAAAGRADLARCIPPRSGKDPRR